MLVILVFQRSVNLITKPLMFPSLLKVRFRGDSPFSMCENET